MKTRGERASVWRGLLLPLLIMTLLPCLAAAGSREPVAIQSGYQGNPAMWGGVCVWEQLEDEHRYDIYGRLSDGQIRQISHSGQARWPDVQGDWIVWSDRRDGDYDIWGYNLKAGREEKIISLAGHQVYAAIDGDRVVWVTGEYPSWPEVGGCSISTRRSFVVSRVPGNKWRPDISGGVVVWGDYRAGNWDIYGADINDPNQPREFVVDADGTYQRDVAIDNGLIAYESGEEVRCLDLFTQRRTSCVTGMINDLALQGNVLVVSRWQRGGNSYDILGCQITRRLYLKASPFIIYAGSQDQYGVAVYEGQALWCDDSAGGYYQRDIYMTNSRTLLAVMPGDFIDLRLFSQMGRSWNRNGVALDGDLNLDGRVEQKDLALFVTAFSEETKPAGE